ncbi:MAG: PKD domain-containing protein, partial [Anaerolineales bacterium]|nr:PKD domain-containing protein [Anaerolineales bacterium]
PGPFDNVAGELSLTVGVFEEGGEVTSGPGTLANVTFTVVGYGASDITIDSAPLERQSKLVGWNWFGDPTPDYDIINAAEQPDQIQHGYFQNVATVTHDIAVTSVTPASPTVVVGTSVDITVDVTNEGNINEGFDVTAYANAAPIETQTVANLGSGFTKSLTFTWDTTGVALGNYTITAVASTVPGETDTADNTLGSPQPVEVHEPRHIPVAVIVIATEDLDYYRNEPVILDGGSSYDLDGGTIVTYEWDFDDGTYATGRQAIHEYTTIGLYDVSLVVTDSQDQVSDPTIVTIKVEEDPVVPPDYYADLIKWKAKAEVRSWDYSNDLDKNVTLSALASNMGLNPVNVTVSYGIIYYKTGGSAGPVIAEDRTLDADGLQVEITTEFDPYDYGYEGEKLELTVEVTLTYDSTGDGTPDTEGSTKTFRLTVKP